MENLPVAATAMLIRKPVAAVFEAFTDPAITTQFWFTDSTGKLEKGKRVHWIWSMYNHTSLVDVVDMVPSKKIEITWGSAENDRTRVEWKFEEHSADTTFVQITCNGFKGDQQQILQQVADTTGGFCWVLAGLKAWLEFGIRLNLVADRFPAGKK